MHVCVQTQRHAFTNVHRHTPLYSLNTRTQTCARAPYMARGFIDLDNGAAAWNLKVFPRYLLSLLKPSSQSLREDRSQFRKEQRKCLFAWVHPQASPAWNFLTFFQKINTLSSLLPDNFKYIGLRIFSEIFLLLTKILHIWHGVYWHCHNEGTPKGGKKKKEPFHSLGPVSYQPNDLDKVFSLSEL